jgi:hypothetical protein
MNARDAITITIALCLGMSPFIGIAGAYHVCQRRSDDCLNAWTAAGSGALAAAGLGATLLAKLDESQPNDAVPTEPRLHRPPNP